MPRPDSAAQIESRNSPVALPIAAGPPTQPLRPRTMELVKPATPPFQAPSNRRFERWLLTALVLLTCSVVAIFVQIARHIEATF
jgi:hypothetical protein